MSQTDNAFIAGILFGIVFTLIVFGIFLIPIY